MTANEKIRVCILAPSLDLLGGQSRQAARLLEGLRLEPSIEVSFLPHQPSLPGFLRWLQQIKYVRTIANSVVYWAALVGEVRKYDILHIFSASYFAYFLCVMPAILLARLYRTRVVLNYRSGEAEDHLHRWRRTTIPTMRLADIIVVPSRYLVDIFARFGLRARSIPNIVELDRFHFRHRHPLQPIFLTSRLLEPLYNVGCVLRAFALIQKRFPTACLTVAGEGYQRNQLEDMARELKLQNTKFIGRVSWDKMPALLDAADIYLNAPNIDNMPSSILECFASGVLVVTTDAGGIPYIVEHEKTGLMVGKDDYKKLAACAIRLLEDEHIAATISSQARETSLKYSWNEVRAEWLKVYHDLVSAEAPAGPVAPKNEKAVSAIDTFT